MKTIKFCDLHTHILPGVDDGAVTIDEARQMLQNAVASDVTMLAVTPHCNNAFGNGNYLDQGLQQRFLQLQQAVKDLPVELVLGGEVWVNDALPSCLVQGKLPTIHGSRYLLTEFPENTPEAGFLPVLREILDLGYVPLVAHPERYQAVYQTPQTVHPWLDMGCHLQLTGRSITGEYGKTIQRACAYLLQQDLVACVASDAHGVNRRSNFLMDVYDHLCVRYSKQYAGCMLYENPMRICNNDDIGNYR